MSSNGNGRLERLENELNAGKPRRIRMIIKYVQTTYGPDGPREIELPGTYDEPIDWDRICPINGQKIAIVYPDERPPGTDERSENPEQKP